MGVEQCVECGGSGEWTDPESGAVRYNPLTDQTADCRWCNGTGQVFYAQLWLPPTTESPWDDQ